MRFRLKPKARPSDAPSKPTATNGTAASTKPPTLRVTGELTDEGCIALIDEIRSLRDQYFFDEVRLRISSSPGGRFSSLDFFAESVAELRAAGMRISTHAVATVASAAAVMLSLGDVRTAHPKANLTYHHGRLLGVDGAVTAAGAEVIAHSLQRVDAQLIALLVDRALSGPPPRADAPEEAFNEGDWLVIDRLSRTAGRKRSKSLRLLRKRVAKAFKSSSELKRLYTELCALDTPVSPQLALELGLVDAVGDGRLNERGAVPDVDGLTVPEWEALYPGGRVPRYALTRHTLILGETGSGKTASGVLPMIGAVMRPDSPVSCALVIDPKGEISPIVERLAGPGCTVRLLKAGEDSIDVMGRANGVAADVSNGKWLSAAQKILARAATLSDSPARVFAGKSASSGKSAYWEQEGSRLARCALALALILTRDGRLDGLLSGEGRIKDPLHATLTDFGEFAGLLGRGERKPPLNVLAAAQRALDGFFLPEGRFSAAAVMDALWDAGLNDSATDAVRREALYFASISGATGQISGLLGEARFCFSAFVDPVASRSLLFGIEQREATVDFAPDIEAQTAKERTMYVYQPGIRSEGETLIAKALKAAYFEATLTSPARRERGSKMPLAFYVADEFQRFVTADSAHGEQSFLDTCRSFGAGCVLATQSTASILHALETAGEPSPRTAIEILLSNTASKLLFRSTGRGARDIVGDLCPGDGPDRVVAVRPPATLRPGECYASLPDGRFERRQLQMFEPD